MTDLRHQGQCVSTDKHQRHTTTELGEETMIKRSYIKRPFDDVDGFASEVPPKRSLTSASSSSELTSVATETAAVDDTNFENPIDFWRREGHWPRQYFEPGMENLLARKRTPSASTGQKRSNLTSAETPSDEQPREYKGAPYRDIRYQLQLSKQGVFMNASLQGIAQEGKQLCRRLLESPQDLPRGTIFDDAVFERACRNYTRKNESRIIQDLSRLLVPSAEALSLYNDDLLILVEGVNQGWNNAIPLTEPRPQPDYSVGFRYEAFSTEQLIRLAPFIDEFHRGDQSVFMATYEQYFPFLACEVKCGNVGLDIADRQNAHSMALAARGVVELFRLVKRENEVHRQILSFSVSHDDSSVRIYGCYPVISERVTYHCHLIHTFSITALDGRDRWTTYRFTKNLYETWMPAHFKRICSAIDQVPSNSGLGSSPLSASPALTQHSSNDNSEGRQVGEDCSSSPAKKRKGVDKKGNNPQH